MKYIYVMMLKKGGDWMNTKISYLHRDALADKNPGDEMRNQCIIEGALTNEQIEIILDCLDTERYFIPPQVGLPAKKKYEKDPSWYVCRLCDFEETNEPAEIALTPEVLVENFLRRKNRWVTTG